MTLPSPPALVVLSDDLTGAVAAAAEAATAGARAEVSAWEALPDTTRSRVLVVDTNSRLLPEDQARRRVGDLTREVLDRFGADTVMYKRIDSLLRGNTAAEVRAWRKAIGVPAVVAAAAPAYGIVTEQGRQFRGGLEIETSSTDPDRARLHPSEVLEADPFGVCDIREATFADSLSGAIRGGRNAVMDARGPGDLKRIAQAAAREQAAGSRMGLVGSYGLLGAWCATVAGDTRPGGALLVASSYQPSALRQVEAVAQRERSAIVDGTSGSPEEIGRAVRALQGGYDAAIVTVRNPEHACDPRPEAALTAAAMAAAVLRQARPTGLLLIGGEVSSALIRLLAPRTLSVVSEPWPATPLMRLQGGAHDGLLAIVQSGAQGGGTRAIHAMDFLAAVHAGRLSRTD